MRTCNACQGHNIKSRTNSSHGKRSKSLTTLSCKDCGSTDIAVERIDNRRFGRRPLQKRPSPMRKK